MPNAACGTQALPGEKIPCAERHQKAGTRTPCMTKRLFQSHGPHFIIKNLVKAGLVRKRSCRWIRQEKPEKDVATPLLGGIFLLSTRPTRHISIFFPSTVGSVPHPASFFPVMHCGRNSRRLRQLQRVGSETLTDVFNRTVSRKQITTSLS